MTKRGCYFEGVEKCAACERRLAIALTPARSRAVAHSAHFSRGERGKRVITFCIRLLGRGGFAPGGLEFFYDGQG